MQHQNYLKRKENGKQKEYEDKIRTARKAERDAKIVQILSEIVLCCKAGILIIKTQNRKESLFENETCCSEDGATPPSDPSAPAEFAGVMHLCAVLLSGDIVLETKTEAHK